MVQIEDEFVGVNFFATTTLLRRLNSWATLFGTLKIALPHQLADQRLSIRRLSNSQQHIYKLNCRGKNYRELITSMIVQTAIECAV